MRTNRPAPARPPAGPLSHEAPLPRSRLLLTVLLGMLLLGPWWTGDAAPGREEAGRAAADSAWAGDEPAEPVPEPVPVIGRNWPVGDRPAVVRGWEPPATPYGPGHRGVDLAAPTGTPVRAVAAGRVSFAGRVAGRGVVSVELAGTGLRTTYEPVHASVRTGDKVAAGAVVGSVEAAGAHCGGVCLHWGLRRGESYLDPLSLLPPWLLHRAPPILLPVLDVPLPRADRSVSAAARTLRGSPRPWRAAPEPCRDGRCGPTRGHEEPRAEEQPTAPSKATHAAGSRRYAERRREVSLVRRAAPSSPQPP